MVINWKQGSEKSRWMDMVKCENRFAQVGTTGVHKMKRINCLVSENIQGNVNLELFVQDSTFEKHFTPFVTPHP